MYHLPKTEGPISTIVIALVSSLLVAIFLVPVLAGKFLPLSNRTEKPVSNPILKKLYGSFQAIMNKLGTLLSEENMEYIKTISAEIAKGGFTADDIVKAYGESKRFKEVVNAEKVDE